MRDPDSNWDWQGPNSCEFPLFYHAPPLYIYSISYYYYWVRLRSAHMKTYQNHPTLTLCMTLHLSTYLFKGLMKRFMEKGDDLAGSIARWPALLALIHHVSQRNWTTNLIFTRNTLYPIELERLKKAICPYVFIYIFIYVTTLPLTHPYTMAKDVWYPILCLIP